MVHNLITTPYSIGFTKTQYRSDIVWAKQESYWYNFDESNIPPISSPCTLTFLPKWCTNIFNFDKKSTFKLSISFSMFQYIEGIPTDMDSNNSSQGNRSLNSFYIDCAICIKLCLTEITISLNWYLDTEHSLVVCPILLT